MSFNEARDVAWIASILYLFAVGFGLPVLIFQKQFLQTGNSPCHYNWFFSADPWSLPPRIGN